MKTELLAWLINASVATSLASLAVLGLRKILQRWLGAEIAYRLWMVVPLAALVALISPPKWTPAPTSIAGARFTASPAIQVITQRAWIASNADLWLLGAWAIGLFALIAMLVWQQRRYVARMRLQPRGDGSWRSGSLDAAPALLGLLRPRLVLPEAFEADYSDAEQRLVIAHERMHQQRRDPWALAVCAALRALFWFNPLLHFAAGCFRRDLEFACDAAVLRRYPDQRRLYAAALLKTQLVGSALPIGCLWQHIPPMKERLLLLKRTSPARHAQWIGIVSIVCTATAISGVALAGHDAAATAANALATPVSSPNPAQPPYMVKLAMSIDGKRVANPAVITRPGETALIKIDENGVAWGLKFHVDPKPGSTGVTLTGDVFAPDEQHVIGHAQLTETAGTPLLIAINDKAGRRSYRIEAQVAIAPPSSIPPPRAGGGRQMRAQAVASATATSGGQREVEIVRNGTPAAGDRSEDEIMQDETPLPGGHREVRREITVQTQAGEAGNSRVERSVIVETAGDGNSSPPLPPLPPIPMTAPPLPPRDGRAASSAPAMHAPPPPPAMPPMPPDAQALRAPLPALAPLPPPRNDVSVSQGVVELRVLVGPDGHAKQVTVAKSDPPGLFDARAVKSARQMHFTPQMQHGKPVEGWLTVPMRFETRREERSIER